MRSLVSYSTLDGPNRWIRTSLLPVFSGALEPAQLHSDFWWEGQDLNLRCLPFGYPGYSRTASASRNTRPQ